MKNLIHKDLTYKVIGAAKEVYKVLGSGYIESVYEDALCHELGTAGISYKRQPELDLSYKNVVFERRFKPDLLIDNKVLVENKAIKMITSQDEAQLINYLKTTRLQVGLLFNFGSTKFEMLRRVLS